ncbi:MAG: acetolactate synthase [Alistipes sp.]|nr:acetolactate synthase [Alistipes sp.]
METIKQLSVFLENKFGRLNEILAILGAADIRIIAATVADTSEYGILRMITSDTARAVQVLREAHVSANISEVIAVACGSQASDFAHNLSLLSKDAVSIEYMYSFACHHRAVLVLRTHDQELALKTIEKYGIEKLSNADLESV